MRTFYGRERELRRAITEGEAQLAVLQDDLAAERAEIDRIKAREQRRAAAAETARLAMAAQRWADPDACGEEDNGDRTRQPR